MIPNHKAEFNEEDFIESLANLDKLKTAEQEGRLPFTAAVASGRFVRADLGVFRNSDDGSIWNLEQGDDGLEYIVRSDHFDSARVEAWAATPSRNGEAITLAYNNYPVRKFASSEFDFKPQDAHEFAAFLVRKAQANEDGFVKKMVEGLPFEQRLNLQKKFAMFREA